LRAVHGNSAALGNNDALVFDLIPEQGYIAAGRTVARGLDHTHVDDLPGLSITLEDVIALEKIFIRDVERRGNESADIDAGPLVEENAVGVDEVDLARGIERPGNDALFIADNAVKRHGKRAWLVEIHRFVGGNGKSQPVDDGFIGTLVDVGRRTTLIDAGDTADYLASSRSSHSLK